MDSQGPAITFGQHCEVASGLRRFHYPECVFLLWHRQVVLVVAGDLQEDSAVGAAFVGLSGGVQEARAEAQAGGNVLFVADTHAQRLQKRFVVGIHFDVG